MKLDLYLVFMVLGEKNDIVVPLPQLGSRTVQFRPRPPRKPQDTENTTDGDSAEEFGVKSNAFLPTPMQSFCFPLPIPSSQTTPS